MTRLPNLPQDAQQVDRVEPVELLGWLADVLAQVGRIDRERPTGFMACCPAHPDRNPSLSVSVGRVRLMLHCFAGCEESAVLAALGLDEQALFYEHFRPTARPVATVRAVPRERVVDEGQEQKQRRSYKSFNLPKLGRPVVTYEYADEVGTVRYVVARYLSADGDKTFRQFTPAPDGGWFRVGPPTSARVLYRLPQLREAIEAGATVYLVEGEKDVDTGTATAVDGVAFTSAVGGAKSPWLPQYTAELAGAHLVRILADNDAPGLAYAAAVLAELTAAGIPAEAVVSDRAKDLTDHLAAGGTLEDLVPAALPALEEPAAPDEGNGGGAESGGDGPSTEGDRPKRIYRRGPRYVVEGGELWRIGWNKEHDCQELTLILGCDVRLVRTLRLAVADPDHDNPIGGPVSAYELRATHKASGEVLDLRLTPKDWRDASWLEQLWPDVAFRRDRQARNEILRAVEAVSTGWTEVVHAATGWTTIDGQRAYVHAGGAIGADGPIEASTDLPGRELRALCLEPPCTREQLTAGVDASMGLLTSSWLPARIGFVLAGIAYRAILPANALVALMVAPPGAGKTEISMIGGQHFAPTMGHSSKAYLSMAAQGATAKAAQFVQHRAKDALLIVDDFPPRTSSRDNRAGADQSAMIRGLYDGAARGTMTQDRQYRAGVHARCAVLSSAEYAPSDTGARERALVVPMPWGSRPPVELIAAEQARGVARSTFMAWVIQQTARASDDELRAWLGPVEATCAEGIRAQGFSPRTADHVSKLLAGWSWTLKCLVEAGVLSETEREAWWCERVWPAAVEAAEADTDPETDTTPAEQLVRLLGEALGRGYVADYAVPDRHPVSVDPRGCGWVQMGDTDIFRPSGERLGWIKGDRVWLDPAAAFAAAQKVAADEGVQITVTSVAAASRVLADAGIGLAHDVGMHSHRVRVAGRRARVWDLPVSLFWSDDEDDVPLPRPPAAPAPSSDPKPTRPDPVESPSPGAMGKCVVCGERMFVVDDADRHPMCEGQPAPAPAPEASKQATQPASAPAGRANGGGQPRWRAAEVVLGGDAAVLPDGTQLPLPAGHAGDVATWAAHERIGHGGGRSRPEPAHVWLSREYLEAVGLPVRDRKLLEAGRLREAGEKLDKALVKAHETHPFFTGAVADGFQTGRTTGGGWTRVWGTGPDGRKASAVVTSAEWVGIGPLGEGDPTPDHLARRLGLWTHLVGQPLVINPGVSFKQMCRLDAAELPDLPWARMAADFMWQRPTTEEDVAHEFVHAYDRRKSYLAACSVVEASTSLVHVTAPEIDKRRPGFWHVTSASWPADYQVPDPRLDYDGLLCEWVATPTLALLLEHGPVEVDEAWLYAGQTPRVTEAAYTAVRRALEIAEDWEPCDDYEAVIAALKDSYRAGIGQMAMTRDEGQTKRGHRPDVRASIIATHRANSLRAMIHAGRAGSWPIVMARADSVIFASDEPDPVAAWPGRAVDASKLLGKYKTAGSTPMGEWVPLALSDPVSPSRSIWAVTDPQRAAKLLVDEQSGDWDIADLIDDQDGEY